MTSPEIYSKLENYWKNENIKCIKASIRGTLDGTELAKYYETVGMPCQDWWQFHFTIPLAETTGPDVTFGRIFADWKLICRKTNGMCMYVDENNVEHMSNSTFLAFMQTLALFDEGCKKIQKECPGDSGEDWDHGDVIVEEMEVAMRLVDPRAFENNSNLWPYLLVDING